MPLKYHSEFCILARGSHKPTSSQISFAHLSILKESVKRVLDWGSFSISFLSLVEVITFLLR